jgi:hypothetical protein
MTGGPSKWAFDAPRNLAVITVRQVMDRALPILLVARDAEGGDWQFLTGLAFDVADGMLVCLEQVVNVDPSVQALADLRAGEEATRATPDAPWKRGPS